MYALPHSAFWSFPAQRTAEVELRINSTASGLTSALSGRIRAKGHFGLATRPRHVGLLSAAGAE
jgi:hypothetical protein